MKHTVPVRVAYFFAIGGLIPLAAILLFDYLLFFQGLSAHAILLGSLVLLCIGLVWLAVVRRVLRRYRDEPKSG